MNSSIAVHKVLVAEDDPDIQKLIRMSLKFGGVTEVFLAADGRECLATVDRVKPDLILLDLNLPKMDGREVLAHIKGDEDLKTIPIVILTTSEAEADIVKSYQLQANCYLSKPVQLEAFESLVKSINNFWLTRVKLPPQSEDK